MANPLHVPRVNNNDDTVRVVELLCSEGQFVKSGDILGSVETDKALVDVVADRDGYVLKILQQPGATANVGSVLLWLGTAPDDAVPEGAPPIAAVSGESRMRTAHRQGPGNAQGARPRCRAGSSPLASG